MHERQRIERELQAILGLLRHPERLGIARRLLTPGDFAEPALALVYGAMGRVVDDGDTITAPAIASRIRRHGTREICGLGRWSGRGSEPMPVRRFVEHLVNVAFDGDDIGAGDFVGLVLDLARVPEVAT